MLTKKGKDNTIFQLILNDMKKKRILFKDADRKSNILYKHT